MISLPFSSSKSIIVRLSSLLTSFPKGNEKISSSLSSASRTTLEYWILPPSAPNTLMLCSFRGSTRKLHPSRLFPYLLGNVRIISSIQSAGPSCKFFLLLLSHISIKVSREFRASFRQTSRSGQSGAGYRACHSSRKLIFYR